MMVLKGGRRNFFLMLFFKFINFLGKPRTDIVFMIIVCVFSLRQEIETML